MKIARSYKQDGIHGTWDAVVIGSGIGGLAAAALLAKHAGKRVLVLERHYTPGGFTHAFTRKGFEWDVGVHYIGQVQHRSMLRRVFDYVTDGALEWADMGEVYDRIVVGDEAFDFVKGELGFRESLLRHFPAEASAIDAYLDLVRQTSRSSQLYFAEKAVPELVAALMGPFMRRPLLRHSKRTTLEVLRSLTSDPRLIGVLTGQYGDYGLPPGQSSFFMHAVVVNHYLDGGSYPVGGASRIAATIVPVIEANGGTVLTAADVASVIVERGRAVGVRLADGNEVRAPLIVSDAGARATYGRLLPEDARAKVGFLPKLDAIGASMAHLSLYVGLDRGPAELSLPKANDWVYPSFDHDQNIARFAADPSAPLPLVYLSFPAAKDPTFEQRFPGKSTIEVITAAPWKSFEKWEGTRWRRRGAEYEGLKANFTERLLAVLYAQVPATRGHVVHAELSTPLSTQHFTGHSRGEIYGLAHTPERFSQKWLKPRTPIPGLFLTGADVCTAGVAGALLGGVLTVSAITGKNLLSAISAAQREKEQSRKAAAEAAA